VILWKRNYLPQSIYKLHASIVKVQTNDQDQDEEARARELQSL